MSISQLSGKTTSCDWTFFHIKNLAFKWALQEQACVCKNYNKWALGLLNLIMRCINWMILLSCPLLKKVLMSRCKRFDNFKDSNMRDTTYLVHAHSSICVTLYSLPYNMHTTNPHNDWYSLPQFDMTRLCCIV
jgi:hypothetical protein